MFFGDQLKFSSQFSSNHIFKDNAGQQVGLKVAMDRVLREKSAAKEMSVPRYFCSEDLPNTDKKEKKSFSMYKSFKLCLGACLKLLDFSTITTMFLIIITTTESPKS